MGLGRRCRHAWCRSGLLEDQSNGPPYQPCRQRSAGANLVSVVIQACQRAAVSSDGLADALPAHAGLPGLAWTSSKMTASRHSYQCPLTETSILL
jgi:hypothetical protein